MTKSMSMKLFSFFLSLFLSVMASAQHWTTTELATMPEAVSNNAVCEGFVNGVPYVYSFAGIDATKVYSGIHNRAYRYNTQTDIWEMIDPLPDLQGKIAASANLVGDIIYIIGGYYVEADGSETSSNRVHRYDTQSNTYLSDGAPIPVPIDDQVQMVYKDSLIYVVTGWSDNINVNNVQIYNPAEDTWHVGTPITFEQVPVFGAAGDIVGDTIYFHGGARNGNFSIQSLLRKGAINPDNPLEISWSSSSIGKVSYRPAATTAGNNVYFLGGADRTYNFDGLAYSDNEGVEPNNRSLVYRPLDGFRESDLSNTLPMDLRGIANVSDRIKYLAGGMLSNQMVTDKLWKLDLIDLPTNVQEPSEFLSIKTFPNPTTDLLQVHLPTDFNCTDLQLEIYDQTGHLVLKEKQSSCSLIISTKIMPRGIYQLSVSDGIHQGLGRFIISDGF